jgi:hypothetical protein
MAVSLCALWIAIPARPREHEATRAKGRVACERTYHVGGASVLIRQERNLDQGCRAFIETRLGSTRVWSLDFGLIEPVGAPYGLSVPSEQPVKGHLVVLKMGDYDGRLIVIAGDGTVKEVGGGPYSVDKGCHVLVSQYDADQPGFSLVDTLTGAILVEDEETWVADFYKIDDRIIVLPEGVSWVAPKARFPVDVLSFSCANRELEKRTVDSDTIRAVTPLKSSLESRDVPFCTCS